MFPIWKLVGKQKSKNEEEKFYDVHFGSNDKNSRGRYGATGHSPKPNRQNGRRNPGGESRELVPHIIAPRQNIIDHSNDFAAAFTFKILKRREVDSMLSLSDDMRFFIPSVVAGFGGSEVKGPWIGLLAMVITFCVCLSWRWLKNWRGERKSSF